ncbi:MAG TPA: hypothetical protein VKY26_04330 [Actinomycetota bacterium]|nr:hypothetical protein [Actinomycetota bacterium]
MSAGRNVPLKRRLQARAMSVVNVPMRRILGLPFATPLSGRLMLLFLTGRRTGKQYRQPVSYVRQGDTLLTPGGGRWKLNLVEGRPERIRLGGHDIMDRPEIVSDPDRVEELLAIMARSNPTVKGFVGVPEGPDGRLDRAGLAQALRYGFRVSGSWTPAPANRRSRVLARRTQPVGLPWGELMAGR